MRLALAEVSTGFRRADPLTVELKGAVIDPYQATVIAGALGMEVRAD